MFKGTNVISFCPHLLYFLPSAITKIKSKLYLCLKWENKFILLFYVVKQSTSFPVKSIMGGPQDKTQHRRLPISSTNILLKVIIQDHFLILSFLTVSLLTKQRDCLTVNRCMQKIMFLQCVMAHEQ